MGDRKPGAPTVWDERGAQRVGHRGNWAWVEGPSLGRERRFQATPEQARGAWGSELPRDVWDMEMMEGRQVFRAAGGGATRVVACCAGGRDGPARRPHSFRHRCAVSADHRSTPKWAGWGVCLRTFGHWGLRLQVSLQALRGPVRSRDRHDSNVCLE